MREITGFYRFILAVMVVYSHFFEHNRSLKPFVGFNLGEIAVSLFFILSGYYVVASTNRYSTFYQFIKKRFLRLLPEFMLALVLMFFVKYLFYEQYEPGIFLEFFSLLPFTGKLLLGQGSKYFTLVWALKLEILSYFAIGVLYYALNSRVQYKSYWILSSSFFIGILSFIFFDGFKLSYLWLFGLGVVLHNGISRTLLVLSIVMLLFHGFFIIEGRSTFIGVGNALILVLGFIIFINLKNLKVNSGLIQRVDLEFGSHSYDMYIFQVVAFWYLKSYKVIEYSDFFSILIIILVLSFFSKFIRKTLCI